MSIRTVYSFLPKVIAFYLFIYFIIIFFFLFFFFFFFYFFIYFFFFQISWQFFKFCRLTKWLIYKDENRGRNLRGGKTMVALTSARSSLCGFFFFFYFLYLFFIFFFNLFFFFFDENRNSAIEIYEIVGWLSTIQLPWRWYFVYFCFNNNNNNKW